jgi:hypothetical protein
LTSQPVYSFSYLFAADENLELPWGDHHLVFKPITMITQLDLVNGIGFFPFSVVYLEGEG